MVSLYSLYIQERENKLIIESEKGFATYQFFNDECYVSDIFVVKEYRRSRVAWDMLDEIVKSAKLNNCLYLVGTVIPTTNGSHESVKAHLAYGFKVHSTGNNLIIFKKEI